MADISLLIKFSDFIHVTQTNLASLKLRKAKRVVKRQSFLKKGRRPYIRKRRAQPDVELQQLLLSPVSHKRKLKYWDD